MQPQPVQVQIRPVKLEIITANSITNLERAVTDKLKAGWVLHGDWTIIQGREETQYAQAVVELGVVPLQIPQELVEQQRRNILVPAGDLIR